MLVLNNYLSVDEKIRASTFRSILDRNRYIAAHAVLRMLLTHITGAELKLISNAYGKPALRNSAFQFNLSHSGNIILLAFALHKPLGVDVERMRVMGDLSTIAGQNFHIAEVIDINKYDEADKSQAFFSCWSKKEAVSKAVGMGLSMPLNSYRVAVEPFEGNWDLEIPYPYPQKWSLHAFHPQEGYFAAIACPNPNMSMKFYTYDFIASQY